MAFDKDFLAGVFEGVEGADARIEKVLKEYENDVTGLKLKNSEVLSKNKEYKENLDKFSQERETEKSEYQKKIEGLESQIKASGNEELKAYYEAETKKSQEMYASKLAEAEKTINLHKAEHDNLYSEYLKVLKNTELDRAMDSLSNLIPERKNILRDVFWARNQFELTELEGKKRLLNPKDNYKSIADTLAAFIATDEGKSFLINNNTGGGATGSTGAKLQIGNPFIKGKENLTEQGRLFKENPALYSQLKAQAEALNKGA
jgi:chromosome segregation ATPase